MTGPVGKFQMGGRGTLEVTTPQDTPTADKDSEAESGTLSPDQEG